MINYDPLSYATAKANIIGNTISGVSNSVVKAASNIDQIIKRKDAKEQLQAAYQQSIETFIDEAVKIDPNLSREKARIKAVSVYRPPTDAVDLKTNYQNLIASDAGADKVLNKIRDDVARTSAKDFTQQVRQPITETQQVRAEGPPIPGMSEEGPPQYDPARIGEVPMEKQTSTRPMRTSEYEDQFQQLSPEAQGYVSKDLKSQISNTEQVFQQPLKTFEDQRNAQVKESNDNIRTMAGIDKDAGFRTAILESQNTVEGLKSKKQTLNSLVKTVNKADNLPAKQIETKGNTLQNEINTLAEELNIPMELASDLKFLGRYESEIDRLIDKENDSQTKWETSRKQYLEDKKSEEARKNAPKTATPTPQWKLEKEFRLAVDDFAKKQFPSFFKVVDGEYGVETMKQLNGVASAGIAITRDPNKRAALAYAYPNEFGELLRLNNILKPDESEIQAVRNELENLQQQIYSVVKTSASLPASSTNDDLFSGLGD